jgi:hypothetical protein
MAVSSSLSQYLNFWKYGKIAKTKKGTESEKDLLDAFYLREGKEGEERGSAIPVPGLVLCRWVLKYVIFYCPCNTSGTQVLLPRRPKLNN